MIKNLIKKSTEKRTNNCVGATIPMIKNLIAKNIDNIKNKEISQKTK